MLKKGLVCFIEMQSDGDQPSLVVDGVIYEGLILKNAPANRRIFSKLNVSL